MNNVGQIAAVEAVRKRFFTLRENVERAAASCVRCHDLQQLVAAERPGYWHFEVSHARVEQRGLKCSECHSELAPYSPETHRVDPYGLGRSCTACHGG